VAAAADLDAGLAHELGAHQSSVSERSASAHSASSAARRRQRERGTWGCSWSSSCSYSHFSRASALLRRQGLVLEGLELGRDEALGVLQRLAAAVVVRHLAAWPA
jgi:hypothetical protein